MFLISWGANFIKIKDENPYMYNIPKNSMRGEFCTYRGLDEIKVVITEEKINPLSKIIKLSIAGIVFGNL